MTRLGQTGFEVGDVYASGAPTNASIVSGCTGAFPSLVSSSPTPRSGAYCVRCSITSSVNNAQGLNVWSSLMTWAHANKTEMWYAFGFYHTHTTPMSAGSHVFFANHDANGNNNIQLTVDSGTIRAYVATVAGYAPSFANTTLIGTASGTMSQNVWNHVEVRVIASTTTTGTVEVWVNGVRVINATGVRTANQNAHYTTFSIGVSTLNSALTGSSTSTHWFDDVRWQDTAGTVNNGKPGDESIRLLVPNGPGDLTQLTRGGTDSGANWSQVDEIPANTGTDYVTGATAGLTDLYNMTSLPITSISALSVVAQVTNIVGGGGYVYLPVKTPAGQSDGSTVGVSTTWSYGTRLLEVDPSDSAAWTQAKLDALQVGLKIA